MDSNSSSIPILLVTANVGSIFEDPSQMLKIWTEEFLATVLKLDPKFIAVHCQEVGGKNYENSMKHVKDFVDLIMASNELRLFDKVRVYLDEDYSSAEHFTALGNLYFIHESVENVLIWNFKDLVFVPADGTEIHSGNIETVVTKEKAKFPQDFFPECKWSRKGFLRTRWSIDGTVFDLINIHLFHDASNFVAMEDCPSVYSKNRQRALKHTLQRFHNDTYGTVPYFLFGDFNFRADNFGVIKKLTEGLTPVRIQNNRNNEYTTVKYTNEDSEAVLTVGKKEFNHSDHQKVFQDSDEYWLKQYDKELEAFEGNLTEFPVTFPPSYPFEERISGAASYMQTRCPAWCDRVLLSHTAKELISDGKPVEYNLMGKEICMGDHKPVYFSAHLRPNTGTVKCCIPHTLYACPQPPSTTGGKQPSPCLCCRSYAAVTINVIDMCDYLVNTRRSYTDVATTVIDSRLLHEPITRDMLAHEPYTPESTDSHSPIIGGLGISRRRMLKDQRRGSVSPEQLATKLNLLVAQNNSTFQNTESNLKREMTSRTAHDNFAAMSVALTLTRSVSQQAGLVTRMSSSTEFRGRAQSELPARVVGKVAPLGRAHLISTGSSQSLARLQSHHSSSDEDWFEFDVTEKIEILDEDGGGGECEGGKDSVANIVEDSEHSKRALKTKRNCCCIL